MPQAQQPVPKVTDADVARVVQRDFALPDQDEAMAQLAMYGNEGWQREAPRVRLAILKLSEGSLERLGPNVETACRDYRDVLIQAEYPAQHAGSMRGKWPRGEKAAAIASDWAQYSSWLNNGTGRNDAAAVE